MAATARDVDVAPFTDEATADAAVLQSTADSWDATFREVGFARIVGHGVPAELVAELRAAARAFFFKPDEEKMRYHRPPTTHAKARVYTRIASSLSSSPSCSSARHSEVCVGLCSRIWTISSASPAVFIWSVRP